MKRVIAFLLLSTLFASAQSGIVGEAKDKIAKEKHASMVAKAQHLLEEKAECESKLAAIQRKLDKLDNGEDVKDDEAIQQGQYLTFGSSGTVACCIAVTR